MWQGIILFVFILTACVSSFPSRPTDAELNSWLGKTKDEMVKAVGLPVGCRFRDSGEEVCEWRRTWYQSQPGQPPHSGRIRFDLEPSTWVELIIYTYNQSGKATMWSYSGKEGARTSEQAAIKK